MNDSMKIPDLVGQSLRRQTRDNIVSQGHKLKIEFSFRQLFYSASEQTRQLVKILSESRW